MSVKLLGRFRDEDGTEKFVYRNKKGAIEITWIKNKKKTNVFCLPTHYYCTLGCKFCHLTTEGSSKEKMIPISSQELLQAFTETRPLISPQPLLLFSFMGVGEPFLNPRLITEFYQAMKSKISNREIGRTSSVSVALATMVPDIGPFQYFTDQAIKHQAPFKIHFSLHSSISRVRKAIIPCTNATVNRALSELSKYRRETINISQRRQQLSKYHKIADNTEIHYTIIKDVNDSEGELVELIRLGQKYKIPLKLLKFNPTKELKRSIEKEKYWLKRLSQEYLAPVVEYSPPGPNIGSSCGQFTKHYYLRSNPEEYKEFLAWKEKYEVKQEEENPLPASIPGKY